MLWMETLSIYGALANLSVIIIVMMADIVDRLPVSDNTSLTSLESPVQRRSKGPLKIASGTSC